MYLVNVCLQIDERNYNDEQKRQAYSLLSTTEKVRRSMFQFGPSRYNPVEPGPSNQQPVYPNFDYNPPRVPSPPLQPEVLSRDTESIDNEVAAPEDVSSAYQSGSKTATQRSHAFGSALRTAFQPSADQETRDPPTLSQSDTFQDRVMMELCHDKYYYIPREIKMDLIEELLEENENEFLQSQITVDQFIQLFLQKYECQQKERRNREFQTLKRGLRTRETYSRIIRNKKDTRNSTLNK